MENNRRKYLYHLHRHYMLIRRIPRTVRVQVMDVPKKKKTIISHAFAASLSCYIKSGLSQTGSIPASKVSALPRSLSVLPECSLIALPLNKIQRKVPELLKSFIKDNF